MTNKSPQKLWTIVRTEWAGQCTGFSSPGVTGPGYDPEVFP